MTWPGWSGVDLLGPAPAGRPGARQLAARRVPCGADPRPWEAARIEAGVPLGGREVTGSTIAAEAGLVDRTVSFTKGCFTGQELVARLDARGSNVARRLCGVVVAGGARPPVGAAVWTADGAHEVGDADLGRLVAGRSAPRWPSPRCTGGWCRPRAVVVRWDATARGTVRRGPAAAADRRRLTVPGGVAPTRYVAPQGRWQPAGSTEAATDVGETT